MSAREGYGQRRIPVSAKAIEGWLINGRAVNTSLPDDARFVRVIPQEERSGYYFVFESKMWEETPENGYIPEGEATLEEGDVRVIVNK